MLSTGLDELDQLLKGGYPDKSAILVVGPPGIGKEALGYSFIQNRSFRTASRERTFAST
jgi:KaiC/GvpD/RAD55 family RecA-like ATPase